MGWIVAALSVLALYLFLIAPSLSKNASIEAIGRQDLAHRGLYDNEAGIPENSLAAFQRAIDYGFGMEMDVQLTSDGQPAVFHDATTDRMTGFSGRVSQMTLAELRALRLLGSDEKIPTFGEFLSLVDGQVPLCIEIKCDGNNYQPLCEKVFEQLDAYKGPYYVESFDPRAVGWVRRNRPEVGRGQLALRAEKKKPVNLLAGWLMMNFVSRPHFIAYEYTQAKKMLATVLCRRLFGAAAVEWSIPNQETLDANRALGITNIFEHFIPDHNGRR